jgi:predicted AAA+ superfamily ATPase
MLDLHKIALYNNTMISREIEGKMAELAKWYPVIGLIGPRQSGKTTFLQNSFAAYSYYNLESPDIHEFVSKDPLGFIKGGRNLIIDEIQRFPQLLSYIQVVVDERQKPADFIISGSENLLLSEKISQSLAGRAAYATLLPLSLSEIRSHRPGNTGRDVNEVHELYTVLFCGLYPAVIAKNIPPNIFYDQYIATYVERDLRSISNISDLNLFRKFLALAAGRIGQPVNLQSLSNDIGISPKTVERWISILESCFILFRLQPYHSNFGKRYTKAPKIYFYDTGLACHLLGISNPESLKTHFLIGGLFENLVISELQKAIANRIGRAKLYYYRDSNGQEVDVLLDTGKRLLPIEIKAGATFTGSYLKGLDYWKKNRNDEEGQRFLIYTGENRKLGDVFILNWAALESLLEFI